jgi:hypothetical protein
MFSRHSLTHADCTSIYLEYYPSFTNLSCKIEYISVWSSGQFLIIVKLSELIVTGVDLDLDLDLLACLLVQLYLSSVMVHATVC